MVKTRPEIAYASSVVSRFVKNPTHQYTKTVKIIMQYIKATRLIETITYGRKRGGDLTIKEYYNFAWVKNQATRKSTSGFLFILNRGVVS